MTTNILDTPSTPQSLNDGSDRYCSSSPSSFTSSRETSPSFLPATPSPSAASPSTEEPKTKKEEEKKSPVKKRKSWGQQLPTPTTNLPPRKRAKTAEEKEQRRVERVLRNRAAAQKSREVKKQQLEKIEEERDALKTQNEILVARNKQLEAIVERLRQHVPIEDQQEIPSQLSTSVLDEISGGLYGFDGPNFTTLNPASLLSNSLFNTLSDVSNSSSCETQQPAALLCDLPCLQEAMKMIFITTLTVWATIATFVEALSPFLGLATTSISRTATLLWQVLLIPLNYVPQNQFWKNFSIAMVPQRLTSQLCSIVLAHLWIATFYSSQQTSDDEEVPITTGFFSEFGFGNVLKWTKRNLLDTSLDRGHEWSSMAQGHKLPGNFVIGFG
ncbi:hypothetical protein K440DRAFT_662193 [Wilcoxina mikolae CBS 423.85]|nr:hypothetical protein K440DRAFT_662193 [Wilcoxina mikolae CBS 423.85]